MSISDDGIPLTGGSLLNGAVPLEGDATLDGSVIQDALLPDGSTDPLFPTSRFVIPQEEPILFPGPVFTLNPVIDDIQPRMGAPGTPVIILGRNFTPFEGVVRFNGVVSAYNATTTTRIDTVVPNNASTGPVSVDGFNSPFDFVVLAPSTAPTIQGFSPPGGRPGEVVTVSGTNLDRVTDARINGVRVDGLFPFAPNILQFTVPAGATTGPIFVSGPTGSATSAASFVVAAGAPTITGFSPTAGAPGTPVDIFGTDLNTANRVTFNGADAQFQILGGTQLRATVPGFVGTGPIRVHTPLGIAVSAGSFTAGAPAPRIDSFSPSAGRAGDAVTINGASLDQVTGVRIGSVRIQVISRPSSQQIVFTVPANAVTGPIVLEFPGGEVQGSVFTVLQPVTTVTGIQPTQGFPGIGVFISGSGLDRVTGGSFAPGIPVNVGQTGDGRLVTTVPAGALTGPITLNTPTGTVQTPVFTVITDNAPNVIVLSPGAGQTFNAGQAVQVNWTAGDDGTIVSQEILYSPDGGATRQPLAQGLQGTERTRQVTLPNAASSNAVIIVRATDNTGKTGEGRSGAFRVLAPADARPMVTVLSPNGGETFTVGQPIPVSWTASDDVGIVSQDVLVSYDGGATIEVALPNLAPDVRSAGFIATRAGDQVFVRVRVTDTAQQTGMDRGDATFRVVAPPPQDRPPMVTVLSPNGGETFTVGQPFPISWISSDDQGIAFHDVRISYDGGLNFEPVVTGIPGFRQNAMCTPRLASDTTLVAVASTDFAGQRTEDLSDGFFRILPADARPMVTVLSPNGGETFTVGQPIPVSWTASDDVGIVSQDVLVSYDGGATVEVALPNLGPDVRSAGFIATRAGDQVFVRVRVTDTAQQTGMDRGDATFRVVAPPPVDRPPVVTVLTPSGGESFTPGQQVTISWMSSDDREIAFHDVRYSVDGGMNFLPIALGIPGTRRNAVWTVPAMPSDRALVAVAATDRAGQRTEDLSDGFFRILPPPPDLPPTVTVLAPNGGELLIPGQTVTVSWTSADDKGIVRHDVRYSTDGGGTFKPIVENIPGFRRQAQWVVPNEPSGLCLVSVTATDALGQMTEDRSDNFFTIIGLLDLRPRVRVLSPNGGETFLAGQTVTVSWESSDDRGLVSHDVEFSLDGGATWQPIALNIPGFRRNAQWMVPDQASDAALVRVTATDTAGQKGADQSDAPFRIVRFGGNTRVTVLSPNGGEQLQPGQTFTVSWSLAGDTPISQDVRFSADGGATFSRVASALPGTARSVAWTVPSASTAMGVIEVVTRDATGTVTARDRSDAFFSIGAQPQLALTVLAPNGGEVFVPGQVTTVSWKVSGDIGLAVQQVKVSFDGGASFETLAPSLPGFVRSFAWTVPDRPTQQGLISVSFFDPTGRLVEDRSDGFFTIGTAIRTPQVDSVFPGQGPVSGGTPVTIQGRNFDARARVRIGGIDAVTFPVSSTMVNAVTPRALFAGFVNVAVINPDGQRGVLENGFRYVLNGAGDPASGQLVFQSATVSDPVPDPDAGLPSEDAFEDAALALEADAAALETDGAADALPREEVDADAAAGEADAGALAVLAEPVEEPAVSLARSLLLPADAEPIVGELPGTEAVAAAAGPPEVIEVRAGETVSVAVFAELFDAQFQPVRDRLLDIVSGGVPPKSTLTVQPNPVLSFNTFIATLATTLDTPEGEYLLLFAGQTLTAPFLRTPDLGVRIRVLRARRRVRVFVSPPRQAAAPGGTATFQVRLRRRNLPGIPVRLKVSSALPAGVVVTFDPPRPLGDEAAMKVQLPAEMPAGEFPVRVTAKVNVMGTCAVAADPVIVEVKPAAPTAFRLEAGEATVTDPEPEEGPIEPAATAEIVAVPAGGTVAFPITALLFDGFGTPVDDDVDFDLRGLPPGAVFTIVPNPGRTFRPSLVSVITTRATPVGRYILEISGESLGFPGITYGPIRIPLEVKPRIRRVEITAQTVEARVAAGQTAEYQLTLSRTGFREKPVQLLVDPASLPAGATAAFDPAAPTGNAAVLRVATAATTPAGTYTVSIGGKTEVDGVEVRGTTVKLVVDAAPATRTVKLAVTPTLVALRPGGTAKLAVKLNRTSATDVQVALRASGNLPAGTTFAFTPTRTITSGSTLVVTLPLDARPGAYAFQVVGTTTVAGVTIEPSATVAVKIDP